MLAAVPRVLALLKAHLEATHDGLAERVAESLKKPAGWHRWWRFRKVHREFGLKFWVFVSGGGALPGPLEQFWNALGFVLVQGYGMTETTALITLNHPFHVAEGTIGKPVAGTRGQARARRRSAGARRSDLRSHMGRRSDAPARGRMAGDGRHCGAAGVAASSDSWAGRAR